MRVTEHKNCIAVNRLLYKAFPVAIRKIIRTNLNWLDYLKVSLLNLKGLRPFAWRRLEGVYFWCFDDWSYGYFHWLFDVLPKLFALLDKYGRHSVLIPESLLQNNYAGLSCSDLGLKVVPLKKGVPYLISNVYSCRPFGYYDTASLMRIRSYFLERYNLPIDSPGTRNLYISRKKAARRRIKNEEVLVATIEKYGFEIVCLEDLSFREQVMLFGQAKAVIGLHGAGLANLVFSNSSVRACEIRSYGFANDVYEALAKTLAIRYTTLDVPSLQTDMLSTDFTVDRESLERKLSELVGPYPPNVSR